jgi:hypothetical protein
MVLLGKTLRATRHQHERRLGSQLFEIMKKPKLGTVSSGFSNIGTPNSEISQTFFLLHLSEGFPVVLYDSGLGLDEGLTQRVGIGPLVRNDNDIAHPDVFPED